MGLKNMIWFKDPANAESGLAQSILTQSSVPQRTYPDSQRGYPHQFLWGQNWMVNLKDRTEIISGCNAQGASTRRPTRL